MTGHACFDFGPYDPLVAELGLGAAALRYADHGYRVLPLARAGKPPHRMLGHEGGVHHATTDHWAIVSWWRKDPAAGIGIATGQGLIVWDLDVKHGEDGPGEFTRQLAPWLPTDQAAVARTPTGGWHIYMATPQAVVPKRPGFLPGVDVQGDGAYVVAAPSRVLVGSIDRPDGSGGDALLPYEWVAGCPCTLPVVPAGLMPWLAATPATGSRTTGGTGVTDVAPDYDQLSQHGLQPGSRNNELYRYACSEYRKCGTGPEGQAIVHERVQRILAATADRRNFGSGEVATILASARAFVARRETEDRMVMNNPLARGQWGSGR